MYCVKCGVRLADTEKICPLCRTRVYHPDILREEGESLYPKKKYPAGRPDSRWLQALFTVMYVFPILIVLLCDIQYSGTVTWSGYVVGALLLGYIYLILPAWFKKPNPVIFVPCDFLAAGLYLLYINQTTGGDWFLRFAFPVTGGIGLIVTAVIALMWYVRRGGLFVFGGASMVLGGFMLLMEYLMSITFEGIRFTGWSLYPLLALVMLGGILIFLGICRPAREAMERRFFL